MEGYPVKKFISMLSLALVASLLLLGCSSKEPVTVEEFKKVMETAGYAIHDVSDKFDKNLAKAVIVAKKDDHQVEFFELTSEENAASSFAKNKSNLEPMEGGNTKTSASSSNYSVYTLTTDKKYYLVSRVGHTMIYMGIPKEHKKAVLDLVESMGY